MQTGGRSETRRHGLRQEPRQADRQPREHLVREGDPRRPRCRGGGREGQGRGSGGPGDTLHAHPRHGVLRWYPGNPRSHEKHGRPSPGDVLLVRCRRRKPPPCVVDHEDHHLSRASRQGRTGGGRAKERHRLGHRPPRRSSRQASSRQRPRGAVRVATRSVLADLAGRRGRFHDRAAGGPDIRGKDSFSLLAGLSHRRARPHINTVIRYITD